MAVALPAFLIAYSDSDFTNPHEVVLPDEPKDNRGQFTHMGAKYWGYESKRHKATRVLPGGKALAYDHNAHNWLVIGLKRRAQIQTISVSTKWYTGNQVRAISIVLTDESTGKQKEVLKRVPLKPDAEHTFPIVPMVATECLVKCYYEGGIARINFLGDVTDKQLPERVNLLEGAEITHVSDVHFGKPDKAVAGNRDEMHMVGWESARTGFGERAVFHLKAPATIDEIVIDTYLHRLNSPLTAHVFAINVHPKDLEAAMKSAPRWKLIFAGGREVVPANFQEYMLAQRYLKEKGVKNREEFKISLHLSKEKTSKGNAHNWKAMLPFAPLNADTFHRFRQLKKAGKATHILYMHYPNGGIHGLKVFGTT